MTTSLLACVAGLLLLYFGGEALVSGSAKMARALGVAPLTVGLTVVAFGTSSPELAVSVQAALSGLNDVALGNVVGSNIANGALILGTAALVRPIEIHARLMRTDLPLMIACAAVVPLLFIDGVASRIEGGCLVLAVIVYTAYTVALARRERADVRAELSDVDTKTPGGLLRNSSFVVGGLVALAVGGGLFVDGAVEIAAAAGIAPAVIALTAVALGTSLPELAASTIASIHGHGDLAVANVVGSSVFNILVVLGFTALAHPLARGGVTWTDMGAMIAVGILIMAMQRRGNRIGRLDGLVLLLFYVVYVGSKFAT